MVQLDHVQLAIPAGAEPACRAFYCGLLGWREIDKPDALKPRRGLWLDTGGAQVHFGVDEAFVPARKAHPAFRTPALSELAATLSKAGFTATWDDLIPGTRRFYVSDPFGNRLEFIAV